MDQTPPPQTAGRRYRRQDAQQRRSQRRARLIEAAVEAFGTRGYRATTIEELCSSAGISTRNFYEEFAGREALLIALHDELNARAAVAVADAMTETAHDDLATRAGAAVRAYLHVMTADPRWARIALVESVGVSPTAEQHRREAIDRFVGLLLLEADRLVAAGAIPSRDHRLTAIALAGAINGLINTWTTDADWQATVPEVADEAARLIVLAFTA